MPADPGDPGSQILETQLVVPAVPVPPPARSFSVGGLLSRTLQVWWRHVAAFTVMSIVANAPMLGGLVLAWQAFQPYAGAGQAAPEPAQLVGAFGRFFAAWAVTVVLSVVVAGAVTFGTVRRLHGERATFSEMLRVGFRRGLPVVGTGLLLWIGVAFGFLLLAVPGILLAVASCVAIPAAVVERPGVFGAIRRSFELTRGSRWPLFAAGLAVLVLVWVLSAVVQIAAGAAVAVLPTRLAVVGALVAGQLGNGLFSVIPVVAIAVAYHDLRVAKEGVDTAELAKVFE